MQSVYLDTTIPSCLVSRPSRDRAIAEIQRVTRDWWSDAHDRYRLFVSDEVIDEMRRGDSAFAAKRLAIVEGLEVLATNDEVDELAQEYGVRLGLTGRATGDLPHLALAVAHEMDYLLAWNCKHLANRHVIHRLHLVNNSLGLRTPAILTPRELADDFDETPS